MDFITIKNFCASKDTNQKVKRQPMEWEKIIANHISDKGIVSRIYKGLLQLNNKKANRDFPGGPVGKTPCSQCRGPGFEPWSGK